MGSQSVCLMVFVRAIRQQPGILTPIESFAATTRALPIRNDDAPKFLFSFL